jgi:predicted RNA binding protein with dsRBD fold (UPF0201 family)
MNKQLSCNVQVLCDINISEDVSKVKNAVLNVFPDLRISIADSQLVGKSNDITYLTNISELIHNKKTNNAFERILKKNTNENSTWFFLNKQAAFVEIVALCNDADESSLGPIKVILEADDIESVIELLV